MDEEDVVDEGGEEGEEAAEEGGEEGGEEKQEDGEQPKEGGEEQPPNAENNNPANLNMTLLLNSKTYQQKVENAKRQIKEIFHLFANEDGLLDTTLMGLTLRGLNMCPTNGQLERVQQELGEDMIDFTKYENCVLSILVTNAYKDELMIRDTEDVLLRAFESLDPEKKGFIETNKFIEWMKTLGEPFDDQEIMEMLVVAEDPESGTIRYEEYCARLSEN